MIRSSILKNNFPLFLGFLLLFSLAPTENLGQGSDRIEEDSEKTIKVKNIQELKNALVKATVPRTGWLTIELSKGIYRNDGPVRLLAASQVRLIAPNGATIIGAGAVGKETGNETLVIGYCEQIVIENLTFLNSSSATVFPNLSHLVRIDRSRDVRIKKCSFRLGGDKPMGKQVVPAKAVRKFLGSEILAIVSKPDKVLSFRVNPRDDEGAEMLGPHEITQKGPRLSFHQQQRLINILLNEQTYDFTSAKRSFLVPKFGFRFFKGSQSVDLLVDAQYRKELMFCFKGETKKEDCDSVCKLLRKLESELFASDVKPTDTKSNDTKSNDTKSRNTDRGASK